METWNTAGYLRLSREDDDKAESDSIANQRKLLEQYLAARPELHLVEMPAPTDGGARRVYAVTGIDQVVAQFSVDVAERTVVFQRTV